MFNLFICTGTDLTLLIVQLLLTLPHRRRHRVTSSLPVPAGPGWALKPLQELHQQEVCRELLHRPGGDGSAAVRAEERGRCVGRLVPLQARHAESVLTGQHLSWHVQLLETQRTLQKGHHSQFLHFQRAGFLQVRRFGRSCQSVIHHTDTEDQQWQTLASVMFTRKIHIQGQSPLELSRIQQQIMTIAHPLAN